MTHAKSRVFGKYHQASVHMKLKVDVPEILFVQAALAALGNEKPD
jgi:hypothetical protein